MIACSCYKWLPFNLHMQATKSIGVWLVYTTASSKVRKSSANFTIGCWTSEHLQHLSRLLFPHKMFAVLLPSISTVGMYSLLTHTHMYIMNVNSTSLSSLSGVALSSSMGVPLWRVSWSPADEVDISVRSSCGRRKRRPCFSMSYCSCV